MTEAEKALEEYRAKAGKIKMEIRGMEMELEIITKCRDEINSRNNTPPVISETPSADAPTGKISQQDIHNAKELNESIPSATDMAMNMNKAPAKIKDGLRLCISKPGYTLSDVVRGICIEAGISPNQLATDTEIGSVGIKNMLLDLKAPYSTNRERLAEAIEIYTNMKDGKRRVELATKNTRELTK